MGYTKISIVWYDNCGHFKISFAIDVKFKNGDNFEIDIVTLSNRHSYSQIKINELGEYELSFFNVVSAYYV